MMTSVQSLFSYTANASLFFLWVCMSEKTSERENPLLFSRLIRQSSTTLATSALISKNRPYHYHNLSFFESLASSCRERKKTFVLGGARKDGGGGKTRGKRQPKYIRSNFNKQRAFDVGFRQDNPASFRYFLNPIAHINLELVHESKSDGGIDTHFPFFCSVLFKHRAASSISSNIYTHFKSREKGGHWALLPSRPLSLDIPTSLFKLLVREKTSKRESCGRLKNRSSTTFLCWSVGRKM